MKRREKKEKSKIFSRNRILLYIMGIFIISVMVLSTFNVNEGEDEETYGYKGYKFVKTDGGWLTYKDKEALTFVYGPKDVENLKVDIITIQSLLNSQKAYVSFNPEENTGLALREFSSHIQFSNPAVLACSVDNEPCKELPLKDCKDASSEVGIVLFKAADEAKVVLENNCLTIQGKNEDLVKITDRLIYNLLGIFD